VSGHCVHCGLTISNFLDLGKFGCPTCHEIFLPNKLKRVPTKHRDFLESLHDLRFLKKINWTDISFRLRVARCFRKGFFPFYSRLEDRARELLVQKGFVLAENGLETVPLVSGAKFYLGEEDHLRFEWILGKNPSFLRSRFLKLGNLRFLFEPGLWAWNPKIGFINSCPTNCGRGDRLSVQAKASPEEAFLVSQTLQNHTGFGLDFSLNTDVKRENEKENSSVLVQISAKNANPIQKLRFFKILGLLGLG